MVYTGIILTMLLEQTPSAKQGIIFTNLLHELSIETGNLLPVQSGILRGSISGSDSSIQKHVFLFNQHSCRLGNLKNPAISSKSRVRNLPSSA